MSERVIRNPILPGYYPDPSICRVGEDYYLITSSFEMCPGIPVFHSKDLANWEQLCYAMTPENGFELECGSFGGGVMAPTIRYHEGTFYIINKNFSQGGNYIVTAKDPAGPWSEPHPLPDVPGIDASLFFDDDGKCYVVSTGNIVNPDGKHERGIWACEFDIENFRTVGEKHDIWNSAMHNAPSPEAPHLYRRDGWYYLMIGEGGTEHWHAVTIARAKNIFDWYEGNPANPVMTHRQFGYTAKVANVGHADMVELPDGSWWAVMLASRTNAGQYKNIGRETFICPVVWERGWPVFSPASGKLDDTYPAPASLPWTPYPVSPTREGKDDFDADTLDYQWIFWGTPYQDFWRLGDGALHLRCLPRGVNRKPERIDFTATEHKAPARDDCVSAVLRRQQSFFCETAMKMQFRPAGSESAGMLVLQQGNNSFRCELMQECGKTFLRAVEISTTSDLPQFHPDYAPVVTETEYARAEWDRDEIVIVMKVNGQTHDFWYGPDEGHLQPLYLGMDARHINEEVNGCMVGTCIGMFASGNGTDSSNEAAFDWFRYTEAEEGM